MALNWEAFATLEGDPKHNFELLCRALVQRNYGRFGRLRSKRQQPGVEFHMQLEADCDLGAAGRWFGWQCRWYDLPQTRRLGVKRRAELEDAIAKTKEHVPGLTDFVLCLRELPAANDVDWYFDLDPGLALHLWADEEIETRLTGDATILRSTYFGELVLTRHALKEAHARAVRPIEHRWVPGLHVTTGVESDLRIALGRPDSAQPLRDHAELLGQLAQGIRSGRDAMAEDELRDRADRIVDELGALVATLVDIADSCDGGNPEQARRLVAADARPNTSVAEIRHFARRLRAQKIPAALSASALEAEIRHALRLLDHARHLMWAPLIAVVGDAGRGKSHLSAQITAPTTDLSAGVFLMGADLRAGGALDDLAARVPGLGVTSFDQLMEALDAAGGRGGTRVPVVIDGLNEAERPIEWKALLARLVPVLDRYENVLVVVTLRGTVRADALPDEALALELEWQPAEVYEAVERYFTHYMIDPGVARLPMGRFRDPLFLRMYCEATNGERESWVGVESLPFSLVAVFELYRDRAAERLRQRLDLRPGYIERRLAEIALELWDRNARSLPFEEVQRLIDEDEREWEHSLVRALEEEGILWRHDTEDWADQRSAILFDPLAGYLVADAISRSLTADQADDVLASETIWTKLDGPQEERHPLAADILVALVAVLPRRFYGRQLWTLAPEPRRDWALAQCAVLESGLLDQETVDALEELARRSGPPKYGRRHLFDRLWEIRDGVAHKLNATFLHRALASLSIAERDAAWTEWIRARADELSQELDEMEQYWATSDGRLAADDLDARAIVWLLTSPVMPLRDRATRALHRFGLPDPSRLFDLTVDCLDINDPYVTERLLGASYGAATSHQMPDPGGTFERALGSYLDELARRYIGPDAASPTSHQLARDYTAGTFELAARLHPSAVPMGLDPHALPFAAGPEPESITEEDERARECDETFGMDFENYVVGPLYPDRGNYQMNHAAFVAGLAEIRGRVWQLGWRSDVFSEIDRRIRDDQWRQHERPDRTERYGKKYGWIAYYELAGRLSDRGEALDRFWTRDGVWPDIDPTFPAKPPQVDIELHPWARSEPNDQEEWARNGSIDVPARLLAPDAVNGVEGPWLLVEGYLNSRNIDLGRRVFGFLRGLLVDATLVAEVVELLRSRPYLGNHFVPECPSDHATFAGEIPWSGRFAALAYEEEAPDPYHVSIRPEWNQLGVEVELLGHGYDFEASRTVTAVATGFQTLSKAVASALNLRLRPRTLDLVELDGRAASLNRVAPTGFEGRLLYMRRDLVARYGAGRRLIQIACGEREIDFDWPNVPTWFESVSSEHADVWRQILVVEL